MGIDKDMVGPLLPLIASTSGWFGAKALFRKAYSTASGRSIFHAFAFGSSYAYGTRVGYHTLGAGYDTYSGHITFRPVQHLF